MAHCFKEYNLDQAFLLPPSMRDWLPEGDLAYFIIDVVEELHLKECRRARCAVGSGAGIGTLWPGGGGGVPVVAW